MLWRFSALVFYTTVAFGADVCSSLPTLESAQQASPRASGSYILVGPADPLSFRLSVADSGPEFRITVRRYLSDYSNILVRAGDIEVSDCQDGDRLSVLPIMSSQPIDFAATFHTYDINFDGYLDFAVLGEFGAKSGSELWWIYDPATRRFVQNKLTRELRELKTNGYEIDPRKHEISAAGLMANCPVLTTRYRIEDNRLILIHEELGNQNIPGGCTVIVLDLIDGIMRVTDMLQFVDGLQPAPPESGEEDLSGTWVQTDPPGNAQNIPMRLKIAQSGRSLTIWLSYGYKDNFRSEPFGQGIVQGGQGVWSRGQGCAEQYRKPGYSYENPGVNVFTLQRQESVLIYTQQTVWLSPCDGHPIGTEFIVKHLQGTN